MDDAHRENDRIETRPRTRDGTPFAGSPRRAASPRRASRLAAAILTQALIAEATRELSLSSESLAASGVKERVAACFAELERAEALAINRGTGLLASVGSTAPFIGLFGTVWGIMNSFIGISKAQTTNLAVVAPGIAEALLARHRSLRHHSRGADLQSSAREATSYLELVSNLLGRLAARRLARSRSRRARLADLARRSSAMAVQLKSDLQETHEINVTPFIDVMLVLLIIFMVAAPLATVDLPVDLPASNAAPHEKPDKPVYVTIQSDLALALGETPVKRNDLISTLDAHLGDKDKRIYLRADTSVPYGEMMAVLERLRAGGYLKVALVALDAGGKEPGPAK